MSETQDNLGEAQLLAGALGHIPQTWSGPLPRMRDIKRIDWAITEIRTILLTMMEPDAAERFRCSWFPRVVE